MKQKPTFKFHLNKKRQWVNVYLEDVSSETFKRKGAGRWAYFLATWEKHRSGEFGELHFVKSRLLTKKGLRWDTMNHELLHLLTEWFWSGGETLTRKNEERFCKTFDEITRNFLREIKKIEPRIKL